MDARAYQFQLLAAEAAAAEAEVEAPPVHAADDDEPEPPTPRALLPELEAEGTADAPPAPRQGNGVAPVGDGNAKTKCPECPMWFPSEKSMYGHLRKHPDRGYKGAKRPKKKARAAAAGLAGDKKPKAKQVARKEADVSAMNMTAAAATVGEKKPWEAEAEPSTKWPVTAKRGRAPFAPSDERALEAGIQASNRRDEETAMILLELASSNLSTSEAQQESVQQVHAPDAVSGHQMPDVEQPMLLDHVAGHQTSETQQESVQQVHAPGAVSGHQLPDVEQPMLLDHVAGHQTPEAEQIVQPEIVLELSAESQIVQPEIVLELSAESQIIQPEIVLELSAESQTPAVTNLDITTEAVPIVAPAGKSIVPSPGSGSGTKKAKKRKVLDLEQTAASPAPPEGADGNPPVWRIPSPASDKKYECEKCRKSFPTYQALGGHMSSHAKEKAANALHDDLAAAHAMQNLMAHRNYSGGNFFTTSYSYGAWAGAGYGLHHLLDVQPPAPTAAAQGAAPHVCAECHMTFPTGQALGGHKRKHWFPEKYQAKAPPAEPEPAPAPAEPAPATAPVVRDFDLNELPEEEGEGESDQP